MTTIAVVLTTHDRAELADRALASIRAQSHEVDRVIVVDDASREPYRPPGDDVTIVRCPVNVGVCAARNSALAIADTDLVAFLDDDDWLDRDFVAEQLRALERSSLPGPVAALGTRVFVRDDRRARRVGGRSYRKGEDWVADPASTTENSLVAPVSALRDIGGFDPDLSSWEHVDLLQRLTKVCSIEHNPSAEYCSPDDDGIDRLSSSWARVADAIERTMAKYDSEIRRDRRTHARYLRAASANRVMADQRREGLRLAWRAMCLLPDRRSAKTLAQALAGPRLTTRARNLVRRLRRRPSDQADAGAGADGGTGADAVASSRHSGELPSSAVGSESSGVRGHPAAEATAVESAAAKATAAENAAAKATATGLRVREATDGDLPAVLDLLQASLGWVPDDDYARFFAWKHHESPFGRSPAWVAVDPAAGDRVVGFRTFSRWRFLQGGETLSAVRAVDTATHPEYQGRGIFSLLTRHALEALRDEGVAFVFNTPNDKSRPGYLKMGWQLVARLPVAATVRSPASLVRLVRARTPAEKWSAPTSAGVPVAEVLADRAAVDDLLALARPASTHDDRLRTARSPEFLAWRYGFAPLHYRAVVAPGGVRDGVVVFRVRRRGAALEAAVCEQIVPEGDDRTAPSLVRRVLRETRADHAVQIGRARPAHGQLPVPGQGPTLVWRDVTATEMPPADRWALGLGDIELF